MNCIMVVVVECLLAGGKVSGFDLRGERMESGEEIAECCSSLNVFRQP